MNTRQSTLTREGESTRTKVVLAGSGPAVRIKMPKGTKVAVLTSTGLKTVKGDSHVTFAA
jgi:hypothetical protein